MTNYQILSKRSKLFPNIYIKLLEISNISKITRFISI